MDFGLQVSGALDRAGADALLRAVDSAPGDVRLDASGVERIDGAGLTALAVARQRCRADGRSFAVVAVAPDALSGLRARHEVPLLFGLPPQAPPSVVASPPPAPAPSGAEPRRGSVLHRFQRHRHRPFLDTDTDGK